jgi:hypothetical protein
MTTPDDLARQLIDMVRETTAPEAVLLQRRIDATLGYLEGITSPNMITVKTARAFLTGKRDNELETWAHVFAESRTKGE